MRTFSSFHAFIFNYFLSFLSALAFQTFFLRLRSRSLSLRFNVSLSFPNPPHFKSFLSMPTCIPFAVVFLRIIPGASVVPLLFIFSFYIYVIVGCPSVVFFSLFFPNAHRFLNFLSMPTFISFAGLLELFLVLPQCPCF